MKKYIFMVVFFCVASVHASFVQLKTVSEFKELVKTSPVPVIVQFEAYWCGPCQNLIATFKKIAPSYNDNQVRLAYIDAYVNSELGSYVQGGYPTVRSFKNGSLIDPSFTGSNSESYVRDFIDGVINESESGRPHEIETGPYCPVN